MASVDTYPSEVRAQAKYLRTAPRKAQLVADQIRGRTVPEARTILAFTTRDAARDMEKVLNSAVANAEANHGLVGDDLIVSAAFVGEGPTLKRWRARARGRVNRIFKRTCHITIKLDKLEETPQKPKRGTQKQTRARKGGTAGGATASKPKTRKKKEVSA